MAYTEEKEWKVEVVPPYKILTARCATITKKDGVEVGRANHRHMVCPGDEVSESALTAKGLAKLYSKDVEDIAKVLWTADVVKKYEDHVAAVDASRS
tara:strand:- start:25 stop:315 length:291 start_codon:yes stop_codon:yes gene_type:complete